MGYSRSRAKCVALQYPSSATRGVKEAFNFTKKPQNQNLALEEKKTISSKPLNSFNQEIPRQLSQSESGMFYELSNRKGMECEKYQDCSWFQQSPVKSNCNNKLSLVESFDPFIDADELGLPMQYVNAQTSSWGDEYLEVFTDDIILEENSRLKEKSKNWISNENFNSIREYNDYAFDSCNFSLKKTDSVDSMKDISSTNPAKVIPISYKERLSNANYGLTMLDEVKKEIKLYSPESKTHLLDSDDNDLNIGREEVVEDKISSEDIQAVIKEEKLNLDQVKPEFLSNCAFNKKNSKTEKTIDIEIIGQNNFQTLCLPVKSEPSTVNKPITGGKLDLNLDIPKLNFEETINVNTPDIEFMDLVEFINEEMRQENDNSTIISLTENNNTKRDPNTNQNLTSTENQILSFNNTIPPQPLTFSHSQSLEDNACSTYSKDKNTINFNEISSIGVSIAERIKTSSKRRTTKSVKDFIDTEDESSESLDDDDDYDFREDIVKRKWHPLKKRIKSSFSESNGYDKKLKEENSSYREKRDKNNEASRRSRQNRKARERHMYETLEEEERRNVKLKAEANVLEKQVTSLRQLLLQVVISKGSAT